MTTTKITADAVERTANWLQDHLGERYKGAATMLRDLFTAREECERQFQEKVAEIGRLMDELAAANERAMDYRNKWIALGGVMVDALNAETDQ